MKYSFNILKEMVPDLKNMQPERLNDILSTKLSEVEQIEDISTRYKGLIVGQVLDVRKHPDSNKLYIIHLDIGHKNVQVVAGAGNMKIGEFVPYTPVGVRVPRNAYPERFDGIVKRIKLAGVESEGMLNSEFELGISEDHSKILILKQEELGPYAPTLKPGLELDQALGLNDFLIEIENKSMTHRGDVFSHLGLAYELSAILNKKINDKYLPFFKLDINEQDTDIQNDKNVKKIKIGKFAKSVIRYRLYRIDLKSNIKEGLQSPLWLKVLLSKFDINPVNFVVDLTNYMALIYGQPMHAFDYDKLIKQFGADVRISVDYLNKGQFLALDNQNYEIKDKTLCIIANNKPIAFAGVIGGKDTAIDSNTRRILLEVATFSYSDIRRTSMLYGINSLASIIYSRQQTPSKVSWVGNSFINVLTKSNQLQHQGLVLDYQSSDYSRKTIRVSNDFLLSSVPIPNISINEMLEVLKRLRMKIQVRDSEYLITPPSDRIDINIKQDLIEEIIRIIGYEYVQLKLPRSEPNPVNGDPKVQFKTYLADILLSKGYNEKIGLGFVSRSIVEKLAFDINSLYEIINAVSPEVNFYRPFIFVQFLNLLKVGLNLADVYRVFEIGHVAFKLARDIEQPNDSKTAKTEFFDISDSVKKVRYPDEFIHLAMLVAAKKKSIKDLLYLIKSDILWLLQKYNIKIVPVLDFRNNKVVDCRGISKKWNNAMGALNMYNSAVLCFEGVVIGVIGQLTARIKNSLNLSGNIAILEIELDELLKQQPEYSLLESSPFPPVVQDFTFEIPNNVSFSMFETILESALAKIKAQIKGKYRILIEILDIFKHSNSYNVTYRIRFIPTRKLEEKDILKIRKMLVNHCTQQGIRIKGFDV